MWTATLLFELLHGIIDRLLLHPRRTSRDLLNEHRWLRPRATHLQPGRRRESLLIPRCALHPRHHRPTGQPGDRRSECRRARANPSHQSSSHRLRRLLGTIETKRRVRMRLFNKCGTIVSDGSAPSHLCVAVQPRGARGFARISPRRRGGQQGSRSARRQTVLRLVGSGSSGARM